MNIAKITKQVLEENKTENMAEENKKILKLIVKISTLLKKNKIKANVSLGGSAAKGTVLGNDFDIDIFIMFDYKQYKEKDISSILKKVLKPLKPELVHGSRDYFQIDKRYEIVPVLKIRNPGEAVNVTDVSPWHAKWVKIQVKKKPKIKDEIKLTKLFFKSIGVYGAESYIKGISGHVTDILIIYYGSFKKAIEAISKWKQTTEIDIEKHKGVLDKAKIQSPLIVIDPIQPNRNASAAVSKKTYDKLRKTAKKFLKKPDINYFREKEIKLDELKKQYNLILKASPKTGKKDIVGAKLMKGYEYVLKNLKLYEVEKSSWFWNKDKECYYCFKTQKKKLPKYFEQKGPTKDYPIHIKRFKKKYKTTVMKKGVLYAKVKRKIRDLDKTIEDLQTHDYLKLKTRGLKIVK